MTDVRIDEAVDGLASFFADCQTRAGVVARPLLGIAHRDDDRLVEHLVRERRSKTRLDGMLTLRSSAAREVIGRAMPRLLQMQRPSGAFDESEDDELALIALRALRTQAVTRSAPQPFKKLHRTAAREWQG